MVKNVVSNDMNVEPILKKFTLLMFVKINPKFCQNLIIASKKLKIHLQKRKTIRFLSQEQYVKKLSNLINEDIK